MDDVPTTKHRSTITHRVAGRRKSPKPKLILGLGMLGLAILAAPWLLCETGVTRSRLVSYLADRGLPLDAKRVSIGWFSPLEIQGVQFSADDPDSHLYIDRIAVGSSLFELLSGKRNHFEIQIQSVEARSLFKDGRLSLVESLVSSINTFNEFESGDDEVS
ncbi:MAG: hypothetical protein AAF664_19835, partial [Planctomycetota bacterium]